MAVAIEIIEGDITQCDVDAIVNAANNEFWMGSGVAGAIKKAGGDIVEKEAMKKGPKMPGEAIHGPAGNLPFKVIIHAAVMGQDLKTNNSLIRKATVSSLKIAESLSFHSIAFPAFGTGVGGFPMNACAFNMLTSVLGFQPYIKHLLKIQFCLFDSYGKTVFKEEYNKLMDKGIR